MRKMKFQQNRESSLLTRNSSRLLVFALVTLFLSACATTPSFEDELKKRAQARWDALLAKDFETAYSYYSPGFRSSTSVVDFAISQRIRRVTWTAAEVQESSCSGDVCTIDTLTSYRVVRPVPGMTQWENKRVNPETWIRVDGQWWFVPPK